MVINNVDGERTLCIIITISSLVHIAMRLLHSFKCLSYLHFSWEEWEIYRWSSEFCISIFIKIFHIKISIERDGHLVDVSFSLLFQFSPLFIPWHSFLHDHEKESENLFLQQRKLFLLYFALCKISTYCTQHYAILSLSLVF